MLNNLDNLTEEERKVALKILKEMSQGKSETYDNLLYSDYNEIPVDIETFITDDRYLGQAWKDERGKLKIYPFWMKQLKKLFPDSLSTSVNNFIASGARGLGKSECGVTVIIYLIYRVMCMKNPLQYYGLKPTEKICFAFMNITKILSEKIGVSKFQETVQKSPWFMSRGKMTTMNNAPYWIPPDPIVVIVGSQPSHVIGLPIFGAFFDEISFVRNRDIDQQKKIAYDMIDTALGGMKTRFIKNGKNPTLLFLASSKRSEKSFLEEHMKKKLESEKENVQIVDEPVWKVKPEGTYKKETFRVGVGNKFLVSTVIPIGEDEQQYVLRGYKIINVPMDFYAEFLDDIDRALCDYAGISSTELSKYISGQAVQDVVDKEMQNPFTKEILEIGNATDDTAQYSDFFDMSKVPKEMMGKPLFVHLDMSVSGDMTGIAGTWIKGKKTTTDGDQTKDLFFSLAFCVSIKAPKGRQISFEKNRNFIYWLKEQGFNVKTISTDSFQSYDTGQTLSARGYDYQQISVDRVDSDRICKPYQYFKSTIYEKRVEMFYDKTLIDEIIDLERNINTGKIDHPQGGKKDSVDAFAGSLYSASQHAEEYAYDFGENIEDTLNLNAGLDQRQQMQVDFEEELKQAFQYRNQVLNYNMQQQQPAQTIYIQDGIAVW